MAAAPVYDAHLDDNDLGPTKGPERKCVSTGTVRPKDELLRFVIAPDGNLTFDANQRLPGRGLWLTPCPTAFSIAKKKNSFSRAARTQVAMPSNLVTHVAAVLKQQLLNRLGLARRGGDLVLGTAKVEAALSAGELSTLWLAEDTSPTSVDQWLAKKARASAPIAWVEALSQEDLAISLGRATVAVIGLSRSKRSERPPYVSDGVQAVPDFGIRWQTVRQNLQYYLNLSTTAESGYTPAMTDPN